MPEIDRCRLPILALSLAILCIVAAFAWAAPPGDEQAPQQTPAAETASPTEPASPTDTPAPAPSATSTPAATLPAFSVSGVEPRRISRESGGRLSVYGQGFGPGTVVRLVDYGLLETVVVNSTALQAIVPPGLPENRFSIEVILADGSSIEVEGALRIVGAEPTSTPTPIPNVSYLQPQLLIQTASTDPSPLQPGAPFHLELEIANRGDYTATNVQLSIATLDLAAPLGGGSLSVLEQLAPGQVEPLELSLALSESAATGYHNLEVLLQYSDYLGRQYTSSQSVGLEIGDALAGQALVLLSAYETEPETLVAGDAFTLRMQLENVGQGEASRLMLTLGSPEAAASQPFAIVGSGNVKFVPGLDAGTTLSLEQRFVLDGDAEPGVYSLPISLSYDSPDGARRTETQVLTLLAGRRPQLRVGFYQPPPPGRVDQPLELPIEVVNIGRNLVNVSTIELSGEGVEIRQGTAFIGALDAGTSGSLDAQIVPLRSGSLPLLLTVHYLDDFNHPSTITATLTVEVEAPPTPAPEGAGGPEATGEESGLWGWLLRILRGLVGLGS